MCGHKYHMIYGTLSFNQCGHQIVVMSIKYVVMSILFYVLTLYACDKSKHKFIRSGEGVGASGVIIGAEP